MKGKVMKLTARMTKLIHCCGCGKDVTARLTNGKEIYPHREDLWAIPFWKCDSCLNYVGCHYKVGTGIKPLGVIPTYELRGARQRIHAIIDPLWKTKKVNRNKLYAEISKEVGFEYHSAEIRTLEQAETVYKIALRYAGLFNGR